MLRNKQHLALLEAEPDRERKEKREIRKLKKALRKSLGKIIWKEAGLGNG